MLRPATEHDVETIRRWRNHPEVRRNFIYQEEIGPDHHRAWWERVSADPAARVLVYEHAGTPCGVVTVTDYDPGRSSAEWGFFLDVDGLRAAGNLYAAWIGLEQAAVGYAFGELGVTVLGGRTLAGNRAVLELHRRAGFTVVPERGYTVVIGGEPCEVLWMERRAGAVSAGAVPVGRTT